MLQDYCNIDRNAESYIVFVARFLIDTGIRPSSLLNISRNRLSYIDGRIRYKQSKTGIMREIKLSKDVLRDARYFRKVRGNFARNFKNYRDLKRQVLRMIHPKYKVKSGHNKLYYFRYLYVLDKMKKRMRPEMISKLLGHNDLTTVQDYIKHANCIEEQHKKRSKKNG